MEKQSARNSTIQIEVGLDENNIPEQIHWQATDADGNDRTASAILLALWNKEEKTAMRIDLWTKEMTIAEMNIFFFQTLLAMSDSFERATQNKKEADAMRRFAKSFFDEVKDKQ